MRAKPKQQGLALVAALMGAAAGPVLEGYDMVSYWSLKAGASGVQGSSAFSFNMTTDDFTTGETLGPFEFWFSSSANRDAFAADPWAYAPKWGGF